MQPFLKSGKNAYKFPENVEQVHCTGVDGNHVRIDNKNKGSRVFRISKDQNGFKVGECKTPKHRRSTLNPKVHTKKEGASKVETLEGDTVKCGKDGADDCVLFLNRNGKPAVEPIRKKIEDMLHSEARARIDEHETLVRENAELKAKLASYESGSEREEDPDLKRRLDAMEEHLNTKTRDFKQQLMLTNAEKDDIKRTLDKERNKNVELTGEVDKLKTQLSPQRQHKPNDEVAVLSSQLVKAREEKRNIELELQAERATYAASQAKQMDEYADFQARLAIFQEKLEGIIKNLPAPP
jgi:regulator of replication initiation timing